MGSKQAQQPQVVIIKERESGCLVSLLTILLFRWWGVAFLAIGWAIKHAWRLTLWSVRTSWNWLMVYPIKYFVLSCVWTTRGGIALWQRVQASRTAPRDH